MIAEYGRTLLLCAAAIGFGIVLGNGAVYFFNRIPGKWLCDYGQEPDEELLHPTVQRVRSTPWKYLFSALFVAAGIWLAVRAPLYGVAALLSCWLLLEMSIADIKYMIVPDQLIMLLVLCGIGYLPYHDGGPMEGLWGALIGFSVMMAVALCGKLIHRTEALGGGDIKLFAALGLCTGTDGILLTFALTALLSAGHFSWLLLRKRIKKEDRRPMVPYISISAAIYLVILHEMSYNILIHV